MSYFDDQYEAWELNDCEGSPEDYDSDDIATILAAEAEEKEKLAKIKR